MGNTKLKKREEVENKYKWEIEDIYANDQIWEQNYSKVEEMILKFSSFEGTLMENSGRLLEYMKFVDEVSKIFEKVYVYANQKMHEDLGNTKYQAFAGRASDLSVKISSMTSFAEPEILSMSEETIKSFINENEELKVYEKSFLDLLRQKEHILDAKTELILAKSENVSSAASDIFAMFNNADIKFGQVEDEDGKLIELTHGRYVHFLESDNVNVRKKAFEAMYDVYEAHRNTLAATFNANIKQSNFYADVRGYKSSRAMALSSGNIPEEVYDNLIDTVHQKMNLMHEYVSMRKKVLGVKELHMYDLYTPMVKEVDIKVDFEEAKKIVAEGLRPMGDEYISVLKEGYDNGWIDIYENQGKRSGAYSWGPYGVHPYVLLNYQENLDNVFTLAHEMGHAIHSYYSDKTQPYVYAGYKIFVAEVASTCNESLLIHHMIKNSTSDKEKAYLINHFLDQFKGTLYRQTMFAEFERDVHKLVRKGETLTSELLCEIYYELNKKYYGDDVVVDKQIEMEWARIPHFYTPFYVYQYATGFSAAIALSKRIMEEGEPAVKDYMKFLTGGSSQDPIELLKMAGVDMTTAKPIEDALEVFEELLKLGVL